MKSSGNFFQPVISVLGLAISLITAILPLFSKDFLTNLFISKVFAQPMAFLSFMIGVAIVWQITEFQPYLQLDLGRLKDRGRGFPQYWKSIDSKGIIWILILLNIIFAILFLYFKNFLGNSVIAILQALTYLFFFLILIAIFSILFSQTKQKFIWQENRENFPQTVFDTLEKNRLIRPWIEIYENRQMTIREMKDESLNNIGLARKMKVKTSIQEEEVIEFVVSNDGKEIIKVLKKG